MKTKEEEMEQKIWIESYGTRGLRNKYQRGEDCDEKYIEERLASEMPGYLAKRYDRKSFGLLEEDRHPSDRVVKERIRLKRKGVEATVLWMSWSIEENHRERAEIVYIENWHGYQIYREF